MDGTDKAGLIVWDQDSDGEGAEDVEKQNTPEDTANGLGDVLARVFGLSSSDGDHFYATVGEGGIH